MAEMVLPGVYITVKDEGLISVGGISVGNIGIVGLAAEGDVDKVYALSSFSQAKEIFKTGDNNNLLDSLEYVFGNGASTVYAVRVSEETKEKYDAALLKLENEIVNIVLIAGQDVSSSVAMAALKSHIATTSEHKRERIAVVGCSDLKDAKNKIKTMTTEMATAINDKGRMIYVGPGLKDLNGQPLSGAYSAAAFAGLLASLPVQTSPTNKVININGIADEYNYAELQTLVNSNVLTIEKRKGYRVVKGITTSENSAWAQITTRRIVDKAMYGVREACNPYIGKLNNDRVRGAMKATIEGFLTRMVDEEALTTYELEVSATRAQEIAGQAIVTMTLQPTFSIDYIAVTMYLG